MFIMNPNPREKERMLLLPLNFFLTPSSRDEEANDPTENQDPLTIVPLAADRGISELNSALSE